MITLVRRVTFDALTGALTRRTGDEILDQQFRHCVQNDLPLTLVFADVDRFKLVNDAFGHDAGDEMLRQLARHLQSGLRQGDSLIRWGGEEFLIVLTGTDKDGARLVIRRLGELGFGVRPDKQALTASMGVAERINDGIRDTNELVELADRRMYEAKLTGRNAAVFAHGDVIAQVVKGEDPVRSEETVAAG